MVEKEESVKQFMINYGWTFVVILGSLIFLIYNASNPNSDYCKFMGKIDCTADVYKNSSTLILTNNLGKDIIIKEIGVSDCINLVNEDFLNGTKKTFEIKECSFGVNGSRFRGAIKIDYTLKENNASKKIFGNIATQIQ